MNFIRSYFLVSLELNLLSPAEKLKLHLLKVVSHHGL